MKKQLSILIAEDNEAYAFLVRQYLEEYFDKVSVAHNYEALAKKIELERFDMVFQDQNFTGKNGITIMKEYRALNPETRWVIISGDRFFEDKAYEYGADYFLAKPFELSETLLVAEKLFANIPDNTNVNNHPKLLIIDDDEYSADNLSNILEDDYAISIATSGELGLEAVKKDNNIGIVLLDYHMPNGWNGIKTLKKLKEWNSALQVIMVTAYDDTDIILKAGSLDALGYITKPINCDKLFDLLTRAVRYQQTRDADRKKIVEGKILFIDSYTDFVVSLELAIGDKFLIQKTDDLVRGLHWAEKYNFDLIVVNYDQYGRNLENVIERIKHSIPATQMVWATVNQELVGVIKALNYGDVFLKTLPVHDYHKFFSGAVQGNFVQTFKEEIQKTESRINMGERISELESRIL